MVTKGVRASTHECVGRGGHDIQSVTIPISVGFARCLHWEALLGTRFKAVWTGYTVYGCLCLAHWLSSKSDACLLPRVLVQPILTTPCGLVFSGKSYKYMSFTQKGDVWAPQASSGGYYKGKFSHPFWRCLTAPNWDFPLLLKKRQPVSYVDTSEKSGELGCPSSIWIPSRYFDP